MKLKFLIITSITVAALTGILLILNGIYSISSDETSRTLISYYWFTSGKLQSTSWLPLHFFIIGSGFNISKDLVVMPRLITMLFGLLTIISSALLAKEIFNSSRITLLAALIILLIPQRVLLSIVPLPEIIFFFLIVTGSLFFFKWLKTRSLQNLIAAAFLISLSTALRYEGWMFAFLFFVYTMFDKKISLNKLLILLLLSAFPVFWISLNLIKHNDAFYFLNEPMNYYALAQDENLMNTLIFNPFSQFLEQGIITLNVIGIFGVFMLWKNKIIRKWVIIFFIPLLLFSIISLSGKGLPAHNFWRTSAVWLILLIPFTAYTLDKLISQLNFLRAGTFIVILFFVQMLNSNLYYIKNINADICLTEIKLESAKEIINFVEKNGDDGMILIENRSNFEHLDISLASSDPFRFVASEREKLTPFRMYNAALLNINYYLLKSDKFKKQLLNKRIYSKLFESNGWILFGKNIQVNKADYIR